jgi:transposase
MILDTESWMNIRRFRALHAAGATFVEIGRECGCDWRTVRKYLAEDAAAVPPTSPSRAGTQPRLIEPFVERVEAWLRSDLALKGTVIHERLVADYGFTGNYQRVKMFLAEARPRIAAALEESDDNPLTGLHRRFEVVPGAQAQVDWGNSITSKASKLRTAVRIAATSRSISRPRRSFTCSAPDRPANSCSSLAGCSPSPSQSTRP